MKDLLRRATARLSAALGGGQPWTAEDHAPTTSRPAAHDFWLSEAGPVAVGPTTEPEAERGPVPGRSPGRPAEATVAVPPWRPTAQLTLPGLDKSGRQAELPFDDEGGSRPPALSDGMGPDWFGDEFVQSSGRPSASDPLDADLPFYDPEATAAQPTAELFDRPHAFRTETKAALLARETTIAHPAGRDRAARVFQDALDDGRWPKLFESWMRLASRVECPRVLALAFELRELWDDSPHLWRYRSAPNRPGTQDPRTRAEFGWRRALAIAEAAPDRPAWELLDDDLLGDWEDLADPCPGFWSFAAYAELRATGDEAETNVFASLALQGRGRRALYLQELCEHLDFTRPGRAGPIDGTLETGVPARKSAWPGADDAVEEATAEAEGEDE